MNVANLSILDRPSRGGLFLKKRYTICHATSIDASGICESNRRNSWITGHWEDTTLNDCSADSRSNGLVNSENSCGDIVNRLRELDRGAFTDVGAKPRCQLFNIIVYISASSRARDTLT